MILSRPAASRGEVSAGWLHSRHTFSFGQYHDPQWMGFGPLRVINEDIVAPGGGESRENVSRLPGSGSLARTFTVNN